jgi:flagellar basal body-associated protein FliL
VAKNPKDAIPSVIDDWDNLPLEPDSSWDIVPLKEEVNHNFEISPLALGENNTGSFGESFEDTFGETYSPSSDINENWDGALDLPLGSNEETEKKGALQNDSFLSDNAPKEPLAEKPEDTFEISEINVLPTEKDDFEDDFDSALTTATPNDSLASFPNDTLSPKTNINDKIDLKTDNTDDQKKLSNNFQERTENLDLDEESISEDLDDFKDTSALDAEDSWDRVTLDENDEEEKGEEKGSDTETLRALKEGIEIPPKETKEDQKADKTPSTGTIPTVTRTDDPTGSAIKPPDSKDTDVDRTRFLESLLEEGEKVPRKVELDLDGIFTQAKEEADKLTPDSTHTPQSVPVLPPMEDDETPVPPPEPLVEPRVRKVSKFKLLFLIAPIVVGVLGLAIGIYEIFIKSPPQVLTPLIVLDPNQKLDPVPAEMTLDSFYLSLDDPQSSNPSVAELEIILHYNDSLDAHVINQNMVVLRDFIFRISKSTGSSLLSDPNVRRQLQADLLTTLNELPFFKSNEEEERTVLSYVQISRLRKIGSDSTQAYNPGPLQ